MPVFHYLALRTFVHATEDPEKVRRALLNAAHADPDVEADEAEGSHGNRILILEAQVKSAQAERALFEALARDDPESYARLLDETTRRVDEHLNYFVRVDKQAALGGRFLVARDDDAITVRGKLRSFTTEGTGAPEQAVEALQAFLLRCRRPKG